MNAQFCRKSFIIILCACEWAGKNTRSKKKCTCSSCRETLFSRGCYKIPRCLKIWKRGTSPGNVHVNGSLVRGQKLTELQKFQILIFFMGIQLSCETSTVHMKGIIQVI